MASLFFFHFSKREKKSLVAFHHPSPFYGARQRVQAHARVAPLVVACSQFCSLDRSRVRLPLDSRSRFRSRSHSLARSQFCSLARAFASRSNLARVFVRGLARSLAHTIPQIQKSTRWYTFVALRTKPAQNGCVRRLAGWANMPAFTPNHGRARKATHTHACGTDTSNFSSSHDRSPRMMLILSIKSLDSLADFFSSANLASFSAAIARSVYVFAVAKSPIANLDCAM